jgi:DNA repair protein RadD
MTENLDDIEERAAIMEFDGGMSRAEAEAAAVSGNRIVSDLRLHQAQAIVALRQSIAAGHRRPLVQAPTGAGKTILAAEIVAGALAKHNRVVFCVPALSLIDQTVEAFWREGIRNVGVIQANHIMTDWTRPVQVASVQTLRRRERPIADVVIIDEAHRWFDHYGEWMADPDWRDKPFIGLSATPWTKGLGKHFDDLIVASTTAELIEAGYLAPFRTFAPAHPDLTGVRTVAGDYHEGQLSDAMNKPQLVADVVSTWLAKGEDRPTLVFGVDRAHAKHLQERFLAAGVPTAYQDALTDGLERAEIRKAFERGEIRVVCNVGTLTTGVDWDVRCIVLARPTKSEMLFVQIIGRGLRTAPGKTDCLILDHSDTTLRLGFVTDIHHDALDTGKPNKSATEKTKEPKLPKECSECNFLKPAGVHKCPSCGHEPEHKASVDWQDGELEELGAGKKAVSMEEKVRWNAELQAIGIERGYKPGWAANQYREKFGVWPAAAAAKVGPKAPSAEVRAWVTSRLIRYAKRQQGEKVGRFGRV